MPVENVRLPDLGWNDDWEKAFSSFRAQNLHPARVAVEDKHHYGLITEQGNRIAQIPGRLLHQAATRSALPKVGDWVAIEFLEKEKKAMIQAVLPRRTALSRKAVGREAEEQVLVTNVDVTFVVQPLDERFNAALIQRYMVMVRESGSLPVLLLNKADLCDDVDSKVAAATEASGAAALHVISAKTRRGLKGLAVYIKPGTTMVFIGASGVGKSTLINRIYGDEVMSTNEVRESDSKGRHTTSWRELIVLPQGGCVIDTPGMREFHIWLAGEGLQKSYADIDELAVQCHFRSCSHTVEKRCAVLAAIETGVLPRDRFENFLKLRQEMEALGTATRGYAQIERKRKTKVAQRALDRFYREDE